MKKMKHNSQPEAESRKGKNNFWLINPSWCLVESFCRKYLKVVSDPGGKGNFANRIGGSFDGKGVVAAAPHKFFNIQGDRRIKKMSKILLGDRVLNAYSLKASYYTYIANGHKNNH
jgi:hypothetical protein